jgi:hypothetical protein
VINLFHNRRVAVIGNASGYDAVGLMGLDITIRCNYWKACDVLFWDGAGPLNDKEHPGGTTLKGVYLYAMRDDARQSAEWCRARNIPWEYYSPPGRSQALPEGDLSESLMWPTPLERALGCRPLTGCLAIYRALQLGAREVFVTGMDLYQQPDGQLPLFVGPHNIQAHVCWLMLAATATSRLRLDDRLRGVLVDHQAFRGFRGSLPLP